MTNQSLAAAELANFIAAYLQMVAKKYHGETTLNELRVMNKMVALEFSGASSTVTQLSSELGIPKSTVSRSVTHLRNKGWLNETLDPDDRRRRVLLLSEASKMDLNEELAFLWAALNKPGA